MWEKKKNRKQTNTKNTLPPKKALGFGWDPFQEVAVKLSNFVTNQGRTQNVMRELWKSLIHLWQAPKFPAVPHVGSILHMGQGDGQ